MAFLVFRYFSFQKIIFKNLKKNVLTIFIKIAKKHLLNI